MFLRDFSRTALTLGATPVSAAPALPAAMTAVATGLCAGTLVETAAGWRPVEEVGPGDSLHTLDGGLARLTDLAVSLLPAGAEVVVIPGGTIDCCSDLTLPPAQAVLVDTLGAMEAPFALAAAADLSGCLGILRQRLAKPVLVLSPRFAEEEAVWANSGVLLPCSGQNVGQGPWPRLTPLALREILARRLHCT